MEGRKILKWALSLLGIAVVVGYSCFILYDLVRGPQIIINSPINGSSTTTPVILISGQSIHTNNITINDNQTAVDLEGNFKTQLILAPGYNIIKIAGKDTYGRIKEKILEIILIKSQGNILTQTATTTIEAQ